MLDYIFQFYGIIIVAMTAVATVAIYIWYNIPYKNILFEGETFIVDTDDHIDLIELLDSRFIGIDCEWNQKKKNEPHHKVATLQISDGKLVVIFQLTSLSKIPKKLKDFLESPIVKLGVNIYNDVMKLKHDYNITVVNFVDLRYLNADVYGQLKREGLASLTEKYIGYTLAKNLSVIKSNWEGVLDADQIAYAATDAWVAVEIFNQMKMFKSFNEDEAFNWTKKYFNINYSKKSIIPKKTKDNAIYKMISRTVDRKVKLNDTVLSHDKNDNPLAFIDRKRAEFYVNKNLGEYIDPDKKKLRLLFNINEHNENSQKCDFILQERYRCYTCGDTKENNLFKFYVVPKPIRRLFPNEYKSRNHHDICILCSSCKAIAERKNTFVIKKQAMDWRDIKVVEKRINEKKAKCLKVILDNNVPDEVVYNAKQSAISLFKLDDDYEFTRENIIELSKSIASVTSVDKNGMTIFEHIVAKIDNIDNYIKDWRKTFLNTMNPRFLPDGWSVDFPTKVVVHK